MNEVIALEITFNFGDGINSIYPVILKDEKEMILIDCGYKHFLSLIKKAVEAKGINLNELTKIIITHHDFDHMGSLAEFKREYPNIEIISSYDDEKYISGKEKSLRLQQAELLHDSLPQDQKKDAENFQKLLKSVECVKVDMMVKDKDILPWCGGVEVIATPGHMPGHISLYLKEFKTLISGDALVVENGELVIANPNYTLDMGEAKKSIEKLLNYDIEKIICYHGGIYTENIKDSLEKIL
ncbi:MBL fold metallo-hydrolase [Clostridium sp.]|uniref:MBL fold metallo-hydrolase n=1 Tax=Clostridium sp. TaxID=1506 RepID=UPI002FC97D13